MSITFPKTWTSGEKLSASDVQSNMDAMLVKQQKLGASDLDIGNKFYNTNHIVQGEYNAVTNVVSNVSGVFGGQNSGGFYSKSTFITRWQSGINTPTIPQAHYIPYTSFTLDLHRPSNVFFQWWLCCSTETDGDGTQGDGIVFVYLSDPNAKLGIGHRLPEQPNASTADSFLDGTYHSNGFYMQQFSGEQLNYGIGLCGTSTAGRNRIISWGVSIEVFYL